MVPTIRFLTEVFWPLRLKKPEKWLLRYKKNWKQWQKLSKNAEIRDTNILQDIQLHLEPIQ